MPRTISTYARNYVRRAAEAQFNCEVRIVQMTDPTLNTTTGTITAAESVTHYDGPARISGGSAGSVINIGDNDYAMVATTVSIPWSVTDVEIDDVVLVTACPGDPELVGNAMRVVAFDVGGQTRATRALTCQGITENRGWQL